MKYKTTNESDHFNFSDSYIAEIRTTSNSFSMVLDNVKILPSNTCNRDIREMRTNQLSFHIQQASVEDFVEEGYKIYDADGRLLRQEADRQLTAAEYPTACKQLEGCMIYSLEKENDCYKISIDTEDHTFLIHVTGSGDMEEWDRFLNLDSM